MYSKMGFTVLSAAIVLGSASGAMAASKKTSDAPHAYAAAGGGKQVVDPREAYLAKRKGSSDLTWCDASPECNGWAEWVRDVNSGKLKN